jgi:antitoxin component YwqK of YwqJK toxin-antitoxin module
LENSWSKEKETYKGGKLMTVFVWKPNGEKCPVTNIKDGNGVVVGYYEDGTERGRETYKDGIKVR